MLRGLNATAGDAGQLKNAAGTTYESLLSVSSFAAALGCSAESIKHLTELLRLYAKEHPDEYTQALNNAAATTAQMLYNVLWVLDPSHIIIECRYAFEHQDTFLAQIGTHLSVLLEASGRRFPSIVAAPQGMSSVVRGAVQVLQREWIERILA